MQVASVTLFTLLLRLLLPLVRQQPIGEKEEIEHTRQCHEDTYLSQLKHGETLIACL